MAKKKKVTPKWLSIARKVHVYLGGSTMITMTLQRFGWDAEGILLFFEWWAAIGMIVQFICDVSYQKEPESKFPAEPKDLRE